MKTKEKIFAQTFGEKSKKTIDAFQNNENNAMNFCEQLIQDVNNDIKAGKADSKLIAKIEAVQSKYDDCEDWGDGYERLGRFQSAIMGIAYRYYIKK